MKQLRLLEVWPGRRLYLEDADGVQLFKLPSGAMSQLGGGSVSFGSTGRMTVQIVGPANALKAIVNAIVAAERPSDGVTVVPL